MTPQDRATAARAMTAPLGGPAVEQLAVAVAIGERLVQEAVWSGERCNWVGAEPVDLRDRVGALTYRALGPNLYVGSSGVALFLAQLAATTGQDEFRPTALAAMRHAISRRDDVSPAARLGFYSGWAGMAAAALRTGRLLDSAELVDAGNGLLRDLAQQLKQGYDLMSGVAEGGGQQHDLMSGVADGGEQEYDLMSGVAGAVPAFALGYRCTSDERMAEAAVAAALWLWRSARKSRTGWSWRSPGLRNQRDLTGLSHGAAGVAVAFLEAFRLTGEEMFATGARNAMRYEDRWLDLGEGNWPDFRENTADRRARTFVTMWCHGAPGIALSRLYAYELLGEVRWRQDAMTALATTERVTRPLTNGGGADFSLCHGLPGNAEPFEEAREVLGTEDLGPVIPRVGGDVVGTSRVGGDVVGMDIPRLVADHGLDRYARTGVSWPCGTHTAETPNLMLGLAGIGYFYLRLAVPQVPSVLLPVRWDR
ncbi:lanthionine synthetase LanC family protein [Nonomuraea sp. NPDC049158]|uniref:lanthionine synthetase LanC family protein n=1 Tax=Nonomuraea sp. NPDC049158 TaxID=3155649 RepID=UPI0033C048B4